MVEMAYVSERPEGVLGLALREAMKVRATLERVQGTAKEFRWLHPSLRGACGLGSWALSLLLQQQGIPAELVVGYYWVPSSYNTLDGATEDTRLYVRKTFHDGTHCWVQVGEHILDITATQFPCVADRVVHTFVGDKRYELLFTGTAAMKTLKEDWRDRDAKVFGVEQLRALWSEVKGEQS
jgi:hypothetical protein